MSEPLVHRMPDRTDADGRVIDRTPCCGESSRGLAVSPHWEHVTCMRRTEEHMPRPPCPRCDGEMFAVYDGALCEPDSWLLGHDCIPCPGQPR